MAKRGILKEALIEAEQIKKAAIKNAENSLMEHFRDTLNTVVESSLNEMGVGDGAEESEDMLEADDGGACEDGMEGDTMSEADFEGLDLEDEDEGGDDEDLDFGDEEEDEDSLEEGLFSSEEDDSLEEGAFTQSDLQEALREILDEVSHGSLGEPQDVTPDKHDTGLMDSDSKEAGWDEKKAPAAKDWTVKENRQLKTKLAAALAENKALKKAMKVLRGAVQETKLFNRKMYYAHKLLENRSLADKTRMKILSKLDGAKSLREAKNIYETLEMALGTISESAKPKRTRKAATLSEALGSHGKHREHGISHVDDAHLLNEDAKFGTRRLQILAGIVSNDE